ncbi:MAG: DNA helicase RecQ [Sphingomonadaceae bacterium]
MRAPEAILRDVFGFPAFRGVQEQVVREVCAGRDVLLVMPTGAGKSICYQVPALARAGCGIVVSPLIALMDDQVEALSAAGVRAAAVHSGNPQAGEAMARFRAGALDLLYVAPERAVTDMFREQAGAARIALLAIDEAHCVSQWGHDFRPDYRRLRALADQLPGVPRIALTATADATTRRDIAEQLGIAPDRIIVSGFDRPNIFYAASPRRRAGDQALDFVRDRKGRAGILYCDTRRAAEDMAGQLQRSGIAARPYHAGMDSLERARNQQWFRRTEDGVMAATIAFGMGIDKPDVRFVLHLCAPRSLEAYAQETGRAGRDGEPADAMLLWSEADAARLLRRIDESSTDETRKQHERGQVRAMMAFASAATCRRQILLAHFGEADSGPCGACDNCMDPPRLRDLSEQARKLLSAVYRTGERFGLGHVAAVLRGEEDERVRRLGHDRLSVFGIGQDLPAAHWQRLGRHLEGIGALRRDPGHGGVGLAPGAVQILKGSAPVRVRADLLDGGRQPRRAGGSAGDGLPREAEARFVALKAWRRATAEAAGVPAYVIFHDSTLRAIAQTCPRDLSELAQIPGVGATKLDRHGTALLAALAGC